MVGKVTPNTMMSASRLPSLLNLSRYRSANDELLSSIAALKDEPEDKIGNEAMEWGNEFEPNILKKACLRLGLDNLELDHQVARFHPVWPLCCSLDGTSLGSGQVIEHNPEAGIYVIGADSITLDGWGVLEAKLTSMDAEDIPPLWRGPVQLQAQMDITESKWGAVCTLFRGIEMRIYLFAPHQGTLDIIEKAVFDFQRRLDFFKETGSIDYYPPKDSKDANRSWPEAGSDDEPLVLNDGQAEDLARRILEIKAEIKRLEEVIAGKENQPGLEAQLKDLMREHPKAIAGSFEIKWPMRHNKAQPERVIPAKSACVVRQQTLSIKEVKRK